MELTAKIRELAKKIPTPFLIMDLEIVRSNYLELQAAFPQGKIFYAIKANAHPRIIKLLHSLGCNFDAASLGEINKLLSLGVEPDKISFGNTIKREREIGVANSYGINYYVADSDIEVEKISRQAPEKKCFVRLEMDPGESDWPLSHKFGTPREEAVKLLKFAKNSGLVPYGLSFHVGSQCYNPKRWAIALDKCRFVFEELSKSGISLSMINLGGGFPIQHLKPIPDIQTIAREVDRFLKKNFYPLPEIFLEPGRSMVGNAGILVSSVITRREDERENWLFIDAGCFHGLMESIEDFRYEIRTDIEQNGDSPGEYHLAGPTCDSVDVIYDNILLPRSLTLDDKLYFINTGAYTVEYNTNFNGIEPPKIYFLDEV
ncbi:MAG: type III PLP-dependent enzyme [Candidatus Wallbacteria bacterium]|nr:type III PLP-dependent enzyme [Candidatus Wallbacteria bacterium]